MAKSFWSKRANNSASSGSYSTATDSRARPIVFTVLGILIVGFLLFGIFQGARWTFDKLSGSDIATIDGTDSTPSSVATTNPDSTAPEVPTTNPSNDPITETSSTTTSTPNKPNAVPPTNTQALPSTGPASNTAIFFGVLLVSYMLFRKHSLKNQ